MERPVLPSGLHCHVRIYFNKRLLQCKPAFLSFHQAPHCVHTSSPHTTVLWFTTADCSHGSHLWGPTTVTVSFSQLSIARGEEMDWPRVTPADVVVVLNYKLISGCWSPATARRFIQCCVVILHSKPMAASYNTNCHCCHTGENTLVEGDSVRLTHSGSPSLPVLVGWRRKRKRGVCLQNAESAIWKEGLAEVFCSSVEYPYPSPWRLKEKVLNQIKKWKI